jgi:cell filamentation protein
VNDLYCWPDSNCLHNKLDIRDPDRLREVEARIVSAREVQLLRNTLPGEYNLEHLKAFHRVLFGDVYVWAGETRIVNIAKPGAFFAPWQNIDEFVSSTLGQLGRDRHLRGLAKHSFVERLAHYYAEINAAHPFREGNGRTQRAFLRQVAAAAGWRIDWSDLGQDANIDASRSSVQGDSTGLRELLEPLVSQI